MIKLFTTHCPKCNVLEKKLKNKQIDFEVEEDVSELIEKGISEAPVLKIDDNYLSFVEANAWVNAK